MWYMIRARSRFDNHHSPRLQLNQRPILVVPGIWNLNFKIGLWILFHSEEKCLKMNGKKDVTWNK